MFLSQMHEPTFMRSGRATPPEMFCGGKPILKDYTPTAVDRQWYQFQIPLSDFKCTGDIQLKDANRIVLENSREATKESDFCLDDIQILT